MSTEAVEDYLKAIYELESSEGRATTSRLSAHLGVAPASVTGMLRKLAGRRLVTHRRYQGARLTSAGRVQALAVIRRHRLAETFLARTLGLPLEEIHAEAHRWEHVLSERVTDRLEAVLGHPAADPHGAPIPDRDGNLDGDDRLPLTRLADDETAVVAEIADRDPALLRYLAGLGLLPGARVRVVRRLPFDGPVTIAVGEREHTVGSEVTEHVLVHASGTAPSPGREPR